MKRIILSTLILFSSFFVVSQNFNPRLLNSYSKQDLENMSKPELALLEYSIDHACYITPLPEGKDVSELKEIKVESDKKIICYTDLNLQILDKTQYFKIQGKDQLLVVKSKFVLGLENKNKDIKN